MPKMLSATLLGLAILATPVALAEAGVVSAYAQKSHHHTSTTSNRAIVDDPSSCKNVKWTSRSRLTWDDEATRHLGYAQWHRGEGSAELSWSATDCDFDGSAKLTLNGQVRCLGLVSVDECRAEITAELESQLEEVRREMAL